MPNRPPRSRTWFRGFRQRLRLLSLVVGVLLLLAALLFGVMAPFTMTPQREKLLYFAGWFGAVGGAIVLLRALWFVVPEVLARRRSPSQQQRKAEAVRRLPRAAAATPAAGKQGGILILVLLLTAFVGALLVQSHALARARSLSSSAEKERGELRWAAADAVRATLQRLADDEDLAVDSTNEWWAAPVDLTTPMGIAVRVRVHDGQSRYDLNNLGVNAKPGERSSEDILLDAQTLCGDFSPSARTAALRDFMDDNSDGAHERAFYQRQDPPAACPDRVLYGWREVLSANGWSEEQFAHRSRESTLDAFSASLPALVTLIPTPRKRVVPININTASRDTLRAVMGLEQDPLVDTVLTLRAIRPIRQLDVFAVTAGPGVFERLRPHLDVRSTYFRVEAIAEQAGRRATAQAWVARKGDGRVDVIQWVEEDAS